MVEWEKSKGLLAATFTPMHADGSLNLRLIDAYVEHLVKSGVTQVFVNGSAGEHASLSVDEREALCDEWMRVGRRRLSRVVMHCGAGNLVDTRRLAQHAARAGVDCVAVVAPTYYKAPDIDSLVAYLADVAGGIADTPFMYYHIPHVTGINFRLTDILRAATARIPNLVGAKCTSNDAYDGCESARLDGGRLDIIMGCETQMLGTLAMGLDSYIGIAFSIVGRPFVRIYDAFHGGDLAAARKDQLAVHDFWSATHDPSAPPARLIASFKACMALVGLDFGPTRLPVPPLTAEQVAQMRRRLDAIGFFAWIQ